MYNLKRILKLDVTGPQTVDTPEAAIAALLDGDAAKYASPLVVADVKALESKLEDVEPTQFWPEILPLVRNAQDIGLGQEILQGVTYLKNNMPQIKELTSLGVRPIDPSMSDQLRFLWKCRIVDRPYHVLALLDQRSIAKSDVDCINTVYPSIYQALSTELITQLVARYPTASQVPREMRTSIAVFLQLPTIKLEQLKAYQDHNTKAAVDKATESVAPTIAKNEAL